MLRNFFSRIKFIFFGSLVAGLFIVQPVESAVLFFTPNSNYVTNTSTGATFEEYAGNWGSGQIGGNRNVRIGLGPRLAGSPIFSGTSTLTMIETPLWGNNLSASNCQARWLAYNSAGTPYALTGWHGIEGYNAGGSNFWIEMPVIVTTTANTVYGLTLQIDDQGNPLCPIDGGTPNGDAVNIVLQGYTFTSSTPGGPATSTVASWIAGYEYPLNLDPSVVGYNYFFMPNIMVWDNAEVPPIPVPDISSIALDPIATSTCSFMNWGVRGTIGESQRAIYPEGYHAVITWGPVGEMTYIDMELNGLNDWGEYITYITRSSDFIIPDGTEIGARAWICSSTDPANCDFRTGPNAYTIYQSELYIFTVDSNQCTDPTKQVYNQGETENTWQPVTEGANISACSGIEGTLTQGFCLVFAFLFAPSEDVIARFGKLGDAVSTRPPFGYVSVYANAWQGINSATSTTSTWNGAGMSFGMWEDLDFWDYIRTPLSWLVWVAFGWYIFYRFKHFSLHG